jgi:murein L,D-transpeptidase YafK
MARSWRPTRWSSASNRWDTSSEEGDGRTPEGDYIVDRRNPNSEYYLSLGIDYPNEADIAAAAGGWRRSGRRHLHPRHAAALRP